MAGLLPPLRPVPDLQRRSAIAILALSPAFIADAWVTADMTSAILAVVCACLLWPGFRSASQSHARMLACLQQWLLLMVWMAPALLPARICATACFFLIAIAWRGRSQANPFHPVMIAGAFALVVMPERSIVISIAGHPVMLASAAALGGLLLIALRCIRWEAPLAMLAGAAVALFAGNSIDPAWLVDPGMAAVFPPVVLAAFFVADDPSRTCMHRRGRWLCGALAGVVAVGAMFALHAAHRSDSCLLVLAGAMLLSNAAAPALDRLFTAPRTALEPSA